jgi:hypothetical protein
MLRRSTVLVLALLLALVGSTGAVADGTTTEYRPPFKAGPAGGDTYNYRSVDTGGRITVARAYPIPAVTNCGAGAAHAKLTVDHKVDPTLSSVRVAWTEAAVDPYVFVSVRVHAKDGDTYGGKKVRGPIGDGFLDVPVEWPTGEDAPTDAVVEFGLEVSSACPSAAAATIRFTSVTVTS